jgi:hypothetical protein
LRWKVEKNGLIVGFSSKQYSTQVKDKETQTPKKKEEEGNNTKI